MSVNKIDVNAVNARTRMQNILDHAEKNGTDEELNSNNLKTTIHNVCFNCGVTANVLTCLKKYKCRPKQLSFTTSTYHESECDFCHEKGFVTQTRDFFYPDFSLIKKAINRMG